MSGLSSTRLRGPEPSFALVRDQSVVRCCAMGADARNNGESQLTVGWSQFRTFELSAKFVFGLAELRRLKKCEQVAAVCYRVRMSIIEFLLVQTGKGRWIFPKGGVF